LSGTTQSIALVIGADDNVQARVGEATNPKDFYTFTAPTDCQTTATLSGAAPGAEVRFFNLAGGSQGFATADSNGNASVTISAVRSESYFVSVLATSDTDYSLDLTFNEKNLTDSVSNPVNVSLPLLLDAVTLDVASNPSDSYRIVAPNDATLVVKTSLVTGDLDVRIYDSLGNLLKESAQTGTVAESLTFNVTSGEAYIVEVIVRDATVTANVQLTFEDLDDAGANGSIATAQNISANSSLSGGVGIDPNFADYYTFTVDNAGQVDVNLGNLQDDLRIDLLDVDGVRIGQMQTAGNASEILIQTIPAGTYFIGIVAQTTLDASPYTLDVSFTTPDAADTLSAATTFGGFPLDVTQTVGVGSDSADYYSFTPPADGTVSANISALTGNIGVQGFDLNGVRVVDRPLEIHSINPSPLAWLRGKLTTLALFLSVKELMVRIVWTQISIKTQETRWKHPPMWIQISRKHSQ
jgi:hypothetical protein